MLCPPVTTLQVWWKLIHWLKSHQTLYSCLVCPLHALSLVKWSIYWFQIHHENNRNLTLKSSYDLANEVKVIKKFCISSHWWFYSWTLVSVQKKFQHSKCQLKAESKICICKISTRMVVLEQVVEPTVCLSYGHVKNWFTQPNNVLLRQQTFF